MKITLDTNCLIDVEDKRKGYQNILEIIKLHQNNKIQIAVVATSAVDKKFSHFDQFQRWLQDLNLDNVEILKPVGYWGISFWNWCLWSGPKLEKLDHQIHGILFPNLPFKNFELTIGKKWVNAKNDVLIMWAHIWNKRDFFITRDENFLKINKRQKLERLGAGKILTPKNF